MVPDEVAIYGRAVVASLQEVLGDALVGTCYVGSIALGGYVAGESDIDIVAVSAGPIPDQIRTSGR
jgi:predicted nucleotidyltransferase